MLKHSIRSSGRNKYALIKRKCVCDYFNIPTAHERRGDRNQKQYIPEIKKNILLKKINL